MEKDHSVTDAATTWATISDYQQGIFYVHHHTYRMVHTMTFVTLVVEQWLEPSTTECQTKLCISKVLQKHKGVQVQYGKI